MDKRIKESISHLRKAVDIVELKKGYSFDQKYVIDQKYLLRLFSMEEVAKRLDEFSTLNRLHELSNYIPKALEFGYIEDMEKAYMVLSYLPGVDAEAGLNKLTKEEQYAAGVSAGNELKKLHSLSAPVEQPD
jgi:aminoglycoside phosphotransferase